MAFLIVRIEHSYANQMLQCVVDKDRIGWKRIKDSLPKDIKQRVLSKEQQQRLMFKEFRYFGWCTVRPAAEGKG